MGSPNPGGNPHFCLPDPPPQLAGPGSSEDGAVGDLPCQGRLPILESPVSSFFNFLGCSAPSSGQSPQPLDKDQRATADDRLATSQSSIAGTAFLASP